MLGFLSAPGLVAWGEEAMSQSRNRSVVVVAWLRRVAPRRPSEAGVSVQFAGFWSHLSWTLLAACALLATAGCTARCVKGRHLEAGKCVADAAPGTAPSAGGGASDGSGPGSPGAAQFAGSSATAGGTGPAVRQGASSSMSELPGMAGAGCSPDGLTRCAETGGTESCQSGTWQHLADCALNETCTTGGDGSVICVQIAEICRGREGQSVCDAQGMLLHCQPDGSVGPSQQCESVSLCQASISTGACVSCPPGEHRCTAATLEICANDGSGFSRLTECENAALCNALIGECTDQTCTPNEIACKDNVLLTCNTDGTDFASMTPCNEMTCDAAGGDCNVCEPGKKRCEGDTAMTCGDSGQTFETTPCDAGKRCAGEGECVDCIDDGDCSELTMDCLVGSCRGSKCEASSARNGTMCTTPQGRAGTCSSGTCNCTPQCNKECGDDGCGGQCPSCGGGRHCVNDRCVECQSDSECRSLDSSNGCTVGRCSGGMCMSSSTLSRCTTSRGASGQCALGQCVCTRGSECSGKCGNAVDDCNVPCGTSCGGDEDCNGQTCVPRPTGKSLYESCSMQGGSMGDCAGGLVCTAFNTPGAYCFKAPPCSGGQESVFGMFCATKCDPNRIDDNSPGFYCPGNLVCEDGGNWCVPARF